MSEAGPARRLLIATALEETWVAPDALETTEPLWLAPWCRRYTRRAVWERLGGGAVGDPWRTPGSLDAGIARASSLSERALEQLGAVLGAHHGERWSERQTRVLLGPWLLSYVPAQLDRWERLALGMREHSGLAALGWPEAQSVVPTDTLEAVQLLKGDRYNLQLMTPMMGALGMDVAPAKGVVAEPRPEFIGGARSRSARRRLAERAAGAALALRGGRAVAMRSPHFSRDAQLELARALRLAAVPAPSVEPLPPAPADPRVRAALGVLDVGDGAFEGHLAAALIADMPTCFVEGYPALRAAARAMGRCPAAVMSANAWHYDEPFKRWVADGAAGGSQLLGVQHGGNYGIDAYAPSEDHETAITDRYYTWGWTREGVAATTVPMPAPKLIGRTALPADADKNGILFVATSLPNYPMQLDVGPQRFERYLARQDEFLSAIAGDVRAALRMRPHRESLGWDIPERIADAHPDLELEAWDVSFEESLSSCRLFVCDHLSTTFAEALGLDKPTILFWDPDETRLRADADDTIAALRDAGILFDDPSDAARAVQLAYADVVAWWNAPARKKAVARFREHYARTDPRAIELWASELKRVVNRR